MSSSRRSRVPPQRSPIGFTPANRLRGIFSSQRTFLHTPSKSAAQVRGLTLGNVLSSFSKSQDKYKWLEEAHSALAEPNAWDTVSEGQLQAFAEALESLPTAAVHPADLTPLVATVLPKLGNLSVHATRFLSKRASSWTPDVCQALASWVSEAHPPPTVRALEPIIRALPVAPVSCSSAVASLVSAIPALEALREVVAEYCIVIPTNVKLINAAVEEHFAIEADLLPISIQGVIGHLRSIAEALEGGNSAAGLNQHFVALRTHRRLLDKSASAATRDACLVAADAELTDKLIWAVQGLVEADRSTSAEIHAKLFREITMILVTCFWREILGGELHEISEALPLRRLLLCCHLLSRKCEPQLAGRLILRLLLDEITDDRSDEVHKCPSRNGGLPLACALACNGTAWHCELARWTLCEAVPLRFFAAEVLVHMGDANPAFGDRHARLLAELGRRTAGLAVDRLALAFAALASTRPTIMSCLCYQLEGNISGFTTAVLKVLPDHILSDPALTSAVVSTMGGCDAESVPWFLAMLRPRPCDALRRVAPTLLAEGRVKSSMRLKSGLGRILVLLSGASAVVPSAAGDRMLRALLIFAEKKLSEDSDFEASAPWLQLLHILSTCPVHRRLDESRPVIDILARRAGILSDLWLKTTDVVASCEIPAALRVKFAAGWSEAVSSKKGVRSLPSPYKRLKRLLNSENVDLGRIRELASEIAALTRLLAIPSIAILVPSSLEPSLPPIRRLQPWKLTAQQSTNKSILRLQMELQKVRRQRDEDLSALSRRLDDCQSLLIQQSADNDRGLLRAEAASMRLEDVMAARRGAPNLQVDPVPVPSPVALPSLSVQPVVTPVFSPSLLSAIGAEGADSLRWDEGNKRTQPQHLAKVDSTSVALEAEVQDLRLIVKQMTEDAEGFSQTVNTLKASLTHQQQLTKQYRGSYERLSSKLNALEADIREEVLGRGNVKSLLRYLEDDDSAQACLALLREGCSEAISAAAASPQLTNEVPVDVVKASASQNESHKIEDGVVCVQVPLLSKQPTISGRRAVLAELNKASKSAAKVHSARAFEKPTTLHPAAHNARAVRNFNVKDDYVYNNCTVRNS
ncbi:hypothetical protein FOZ61_009333 [Perkinsus olseni]|uniref:Uncharacterized protein n=1 Tax=Perkinsus olseni TaxID=32597 RepID=A0A7J6L159_PEROL|nr:hypothetical protein FOZ61_009333 [Perkinsus olseni]